MILKKRADSSNTSICFEDMSNSFKFCFFVLNQNTKTKWNK